MSTPSPDSLNKNITETYHSLNKLDNRKQNITMSINEQKERQRRASEVATQTKQSPIEGDKIAKRATMPALMQPSPSIAVPGSREAIPQGAMSEVPLPKQEPREIPRATDSFSNVFTKTRANERINPFYTVTPSPPPPSAPVRITVSNPEPSLPRSLTSSTASIRGAGKRPAILIGILQLLLVFGSVFAILEGMFLAALAWVLRAKYPIPMTASFGHYVVYIGVSVFIAGVFGMGGTYARSNRRKVLMGALVIIIIVAIITQFWSMVEIRRAILIDSDTISSNWTSISEEGKGSVQELGKCCGWNALNDRTAQPCGYARPCSAVIGDWQSWLDSTTVGVFILLLVHQVCLILLATLLCILS
jgi:hypothetical protein